MSGPDRQTPAGARTASAKDRVAETVVGSGNGCGRAVLRAAGPESRIAAPGRALADEGTGAGRGAADAAIAGGEHRRRAPHNGRHRGAGDDNRSVGHIIDDRADQERTWRVAREQAKAGGPGALSCDGR